MQKGIRYKISSKEFDNTIQKYNLFIIFFMHFSEIINYENGIYIFKIYEEKYNIINKKLKKCLMD